MRYIGSKRKVINFLDECIHSVIDYKKGRSFADLFSGTTVVSQHFKKLGYRIISNDYMNFSYLFQLAYIKNNNEPSFSELKKNGINDYVSAIKLLNDVDSQKGFFYKNYCLEGAKNKEFQRNYFSEENAIKIDSILNKIGDWKEQELITLEEESVLKTSLIKAVNRVSNISGTYGAFLKKDDPRKYHKLKMEPIEFIPSEYEHTCYYKDIFDLIKEINGDILYLDPPYNNRQYPPYYHILETLSLDDNPEIYGKTGRRPYKNKLSPFCIKSKVKDSFHEIMENADFKHIFVSYNTEGLISKEELKKILDNYGTTKLFTQDQRRFKSNSNGKKPPELQEVLIYVKKPQ